jgi:hypothetical protein
MMSRYRSTLVDAGQEVGVDHRFVKARFSANYRVIPCAAAEKQAGKRRLTQAFAR